MGKKEKKEEELFKDMMKNGRLRNYTEKEAHFIINERYGNASTKFIDQLINLWGDNNPTQKHFRDALNEIKRKRGDS